VDFTDVYKHLTERSRDGVRLSSWWCAVEGQESVGTNWNTGNSI